MNTPLLNVVGAAAGRISDGGWLMLAFGCVFLYGGLIFGIIRALRGKLPYPEVILQKAADAGWLVALGTLAIIWYVATLLRDAGYTKAPLWTLFYVLIYLLICVPLAILCRHLVIVHYKLTQHREMESAEDTGTGGTTD